MDYFFLDSQKSPQRSRRFMHALYMAARATGANCAIGDKYQACKALVTYGLGGADRYPVAMAHQAKGRPVLSFDLGYWERDLPARKYRFSLDGLHPTQVMQGECPSPARFESAGLQLDSIAVAKRGPIMLVGNAPKSIAVGAKNWTAFKSRELREVFPNRRILYRPKPKRPMECGVVYHNISTAPIDQELRRVSLVVCRHSNVAVDAARFGVPVVAEDGAAACIYPGALDQWQNQPDDTTRREFLHRLAWWQWSADETTQFWRWFFRAFPEHDYRPARKPGRRLRD